MAPINIWTIWCPGEDEEICEAHETDLRNLKIMNDLYLFLLAATQLSPSLYQYFYNILLR